MNDCACKLCGYEKDGLEPHPIEKCVEWLGWRVDQLEAGTPRSYDGLKLPWMKALCRALDKARQGDDIPAILIAAIHEEMRRRWKEFLP